LIKLCKAKKQGLTNTETNF